MYVVGTQKNRLNFGYPKHMFKLMGMSLDGHKE